MSKVTAVEHYARFVSRVKKDNRKFTTASAAEKRVIIAKDALLHWKSGILTPTNGTYGHIWLAMPGNTIDLRDAMVKRAPVCRACARGGIVLATLLRRDKVRGSSFDGEIDVKEFPRRMMRAMELAFEGPRGPLWNTLPLSELLLLRDWVAATSYKVGPKGELIDEGSYRFKRIMQWIIDHKGSFRLGQFLRAEIKLAQRPGRRKIKKK